MAGIFQDTDFQKTNLNTVKELKENVWRKAENEELEAFLGFYLKMKAAKRYRTAIVVVLLAFLILAGELWFEFLCKNDPSYNPFPIAAGMMALIIIFVLLVCIRRFNILKELNDIKKYVYTTDAIAYGNGVKVQVMVNHKRLAFDEYSFNEPVSPMEKVYSPDGTYEGFHVLLYAVVKEDICIMKAVLGNEGIRYYVHRCRKFAKNPKQVF